MTLRKTKLVFGTQGGLINDTGITPVWVPKLEKMKTVHPKYGKYVYPSFYLSIDRFTYLLWTLFVDSLFGLSVWTLCVDSLGTKIIFWGAPKK